MAQRKRKSLTPEQKAKREAEKTANFVRLAGKRVNVAITKIGYVGNCFSNTYNWTPQQAGKLIAALQDAVANVEARATKSEQRAEGFTW